MPDRAAHLLQAQRNESFLRYIDAPDLPHQEWVVTVRFYVCVKYVDAFLATKGHQQVRDHDDRFTKMQLYPETRALVDDFEILFKDSKEARYECASYTPADLATIKGLYDSIRAKIRSALSLP